MMFTLKICKPPDTVYPNFKVEHMALQKLGVFSLSSPANTQKQPPEMSFKKSRSWKLRKTHWKQVRLSLFFNKPVLLLKKRLLYRCFPMNCEIFFKNTFFIETSCGRFCMYPFAFFWNIVNLDTMYK